MKTANIQQIRIHLGRPCSYYLGENISAQFGDYLNEYDYDRVAVVAGRTPFRLFGAEFTRELTRYGIPHFVVLIEDTEASKSWTGLSSLCETLLEGGVTRDSIIVALGGGVTGNVAGMAAGLIFRGIRYVEVPTTMMAQTDSVLSQKQAVNGRTGKNQFGLYHTPLFIWADTAYLRTEPVRQTKSAIVEGVKNGLVNSPAWLAELSAILGEGMAAVYSQLTDFTRKLVESKLAILDRDPSEKEYAIALEYGHTFGHAIEWLSGGSLYHGEAVSIGMCAEAQLSSLLGILRDDTLALHYQVLGELLGAPVSIPRHLLSRSIYSTMLHDNKRSRAGLTCLLLKEPGHLCNDGGNYLIRVEETEVMYALEAAHEKSTFAARAVAS
jgi:3-dehydroquinate synthase